MRGKPQDTDPHAPHFFSPFDDLGNARTINNAVDCGWSAIEGKKMKSKIHEGLHPQFCSCGMFGHNGQQMSEQERRVYVAVAEGKSIDQLGREIGVDVNQWDSIHSRLFGK